jgi:hypothetical protein
MTNDVLEQIAEDYFRSLGYFTQHNIKYRPKLREAKYSVHSDIDIVGYNPNIKGLSKVVVASCKSWQGGLNLTSTLKLLEGAPNKKVAGKEFWKLFREITDQTWAKALQEKVAELTGTKNFTFYLILTRFKGKREDWELNELFRKNLPGCKIKLVSMEEMLLQLQEQLTITPAHSELSRMLQLIRAGGGKVIYQ